MAASRPRRRRAPPLLWVLCAALGVAHALPARPDAMLEPEAGSFGLRLRAVRRPDGSSHITHTSAHTTHTTGHTSGHASGQGVRVAADSLAAASAPQPEGQFGDRTRPVKGQAPGSKIGTWSSHPDIKVELPPGLDDSLGPANGNDGVQAQRDGTEADGKPVDGEEKPAEEEKETSDKAGDGSQADEKPMDGEQKPTQDEKETSDKNGDGAKADEEPTDGEEKPTEEKKETADQPGDADDTRQQLPDTHVVLPPAWDEPGFKPPVNDDAVRGEGSEAAGDSVNKRPGTTVQLPPVDGEPGLRPPGEEEEGEKEADETKQNLPDTLVVLPPSWDEPGFRPPESDAVRDEGNKEGEDTRNKETNTTVQLPPGDENVGDRPSEDKEGMREEENGKDDGTRQKLPDTLVVLPPAWDEPGFQPPANEEPLRDEDTQDNSKAPEQSDASPGQKPTPAKDESSSATPSGDAPPSKDSTKQDDAKKTEEPEPEKSSPQNVKDDQPSPEKPDMKNEENSQKKNPEEDKKPAEMEPVDKPQDALPDSPQSNTKSGGAATVDDPPRLQVPPEFYLTRKNHAARPHVRPTPAPSDRPDFIAENPLFEWTFPCSSQEKSCLEEDRVLYEGDRKCYQLWRAGPCERGQWLVIDKVEALNGSGHFRAVCANMSRCPEREVFMASDRRCHPFAQIIREICPKHEGLQLSYNVFGEGECKCDNCPHPQLPTNTFGEGRCAFPPSFYRASAHAGLEAAWRAAMADAAAKTHAGAGAARARARARAGRRVA